MKVTRSQDSNAQPSRDRSVEERTGIQGSTIEACNRMVTTINAKERAIVNSRDPIVISPLSIALRALLMSKFNNLFGPVQELEQSNYGPDDMGFTRPADPRNI